MSGLSLEAANRRASIDLDDTLRHGEREAGGVTNAAMAAACVVDKKEIHRFRDPNDPRQISAARLLYLAPFSVARGVVARAFARRLEDEPAAGSTESQALLAAASASALASEINAALASGPLDEEKKARIRQRICALGRDGLRLLVRLGGEGLEALG